MIVFTFVDNAKTLFALETQTNQPQASFDLPEDNVIYSDNIIDMQRALNYYKQAIIEAKKKSDNPRLGKLYQKSAQIYQKTGNLDLAISYYQDALNIFSSIQAIQSSITVEKEIINIYEFLNDCKNILLHQENIILLIQKIGEPIQEADANLLMGRYARKCFKVERSEDFLRRAQQIYQDEQYYIGIAQVYNEFAYIFLEKKERAKGLNFLERSISTADNLLKSQKISDSLSKNNITLLKRSTAESLRSKAILCVEDENFDCALSNLDSAIILFQEIHDNFELSSTMNSIGNAYLALKQYDKAMEQFKKVISMDDVVSSNKSTIIESYLGVAKCYEYSGNVSSIKNAMESAQTALLIAQTNAVVASEVSALRYIAYLNQREGRLGLTMKYLETAKLSATKTLDPKDDILIISETAKAYHHQEDNTKSISFYQEALNLSNQNGAVDILAQILIDMGEVLLETNEIKSGLDYTKRGALQSCWQKQSDCSQQLFLWYWRSFTYGDKQQSLSAIDYFQKFVDSKIMKLQYYEERIQAMKQRITIEFDSTHGVGVVLNAIADKTDTETLKTEKSSKDKNSIKKQPPLIKKGDIILRYDNTPIYTPSIVKDLFGNKSNKPKNVLILRDGKLIELAISSSFGELIAISPVEYRMH